MKSAPATDKDWAVEEKVYVKGVDSIQHTLVGGYSVDLEVVLVMLR